jgi:hypothetical protein
MQEPAAHTAPDEGGTLEVRVSYLEARLTELEELRSNLSMLGETLEHFTVILGNLVQQHPELADEPTVSDAHNRIGELVGELSALLR